MVSSRFHNIAQEKMAGNHIKYIIGLLALSTVLKQPFFLSLRVK